MKMARWTLVMVLSIGLTGCLSAESYLDPRYTTTSYNDIKPVSQKHAVDLEVEFQWNGRRRPSGIYTLRVNAEQSLRATGVIEVNPNAPITIKMIVNHVTGFGHLADKGLATDFTFKPGRSDIQEYFEATIELKHNNGTVTSREYKSIVQTIITSIGDATPPFEGVEPVEPEDAFGKVIENFILNFVKDMQDENLLSLNGPVDRVGT